MTAVGLLPLISLLLICLTIYRWRPSAGNQSGALYAFMSGSTLWGVVLVAATEVLSFFGAITFSSLLSFWTAAAIVSAVFWIRVRRKYPVPPGNPWPRYSLGQKLLLAAILAITATIGAIAFIAPPNTWDSMYYHMPRVVYWIQNQTVEFYPTHYPSQNQLAPGAEHIVMHLQLLSGSDRLANFVQWYALIGCMVASAFLCLRFGLGRTAALCSALFVATIPMGILEASSTYTDYVMTFWIMCFACFTLRPEELNRTDAVSRLLPGLALGLAIFTKATAYLYAAPYLILYAILEIRKRRYAAATPLALCAALILLINVLYYARCYQLCGNPLGITETIVDREKDINGSVVNETFTPKAILSNLIRNTATHFHMTPSVKVNLAVEDAVIRLHEFLGMDVEDRRTTWANSKFRANTNKKVLKDPGERRNYRSDEGVSNPLHFLMIVLSLVIISGRKSLRKRDGLLLYALCCVAGFFLFSSFLKWQPFHSRLHMSFFVLSAPFVAAALFDVKDHRIGIIGRALSMIVLTGMAVPTLLYSCERPLLGEHSMLPKQRNERYFWYPHRKEPFTNAQQFLKDRKLSAVGFVGGNADWEYPMMVLLREDHPDVRFLDVNVTDHSKIKYGLKRFRDFCPDAIISLRRSNNKQIESGIFHNGRVFQLRSKEGHIGVFLPANEQEQNQKPLNP